jgi:hypothetical protein
LQLIPERLSELLAYSPESGEFIWIAPASRRVKVGAVAGSLTSGGYISIRVDGVAYQAHRLAWLWVTGQWPTHEIDHRDGVRTNNRIGNLRDATRLVNAQNMRLPKRNSKSGVLGVVPYGDRWIARITAKRKEKHLGIFDTSDAAHAAYLSAKRELHEGCTL